MYYDKEMDKLTIFKAHCNDCHIDTDDAICRYCNKPTVQHEKKKDL